METQVQTQEVRYFWTGWFTCQSFRALALLFTLLSFADLVATVRMMHYGVQEGNPLADHFLKAFGETGFIGYKFLLVAVVLAATWAVRRTNPSLAAKVLWMGAITMGFIMLRHVAITVMLSFR